MQLSEESILFTVTAAFPKDFDRRLRQLERPSPTFVAGDDFFNTFPYFIETAVKAAELLRSLIRLLDEGIAKNQILFDAKNEAILKRKFLEWDKSTEPIYQYLPILLSSRKRSDLVSRFLSASEFILGWISKQSDYENGVLDVDLPKQLPVGGPSESWYMETFDRTI